MIRTTLIILSVTTLSFFLHHDAHAARPRRPSAAQIKKAQEQMAYMQLEMLRYQSEMAAKTQEIQKSFDDNGNGHLEGAEKARFDKHMRAIQNGKEPNPFATIAPVGQGKRPKDPLSELKLKAATMQAR